MYQRQEISSDIEKDILTGLIINTKFGAQVLQKALKLEHFKSQYMRRIFSWIMDYYKDYQKAPVGEMEIIFNSNKAKLKQEESDFIELLLTDISDRYVGQENFNIDYLLDKTLEYCRLRNMTIMVDEVDKHLGKNQVDKAKQVIEGFNQIAATTSKWVNPFDRDTVYEMLHDEEQDNLFMLPGVLGELVGGYLKRNWLVAYMGPAKRGKSYRLQDDIAFEALTNGFKVAYVSLEMSDKEVTRRIYSRLTAGTKQGHDVIIPVFDCKSNQDDSCQKQERINRLALKRTDEEDDKEGFPLYNMDNKGYLTCTHCRRHRLPDYIPTVWYEQHESTKQSPELVIKKTKVYKRIFQDNLRVISYPPFSVDFDHIVADIDSLEYTEGFIPDVICIDYFDIVGDEKSHLDQRGQIDNKWKKGKALAKTKHCLVATVSQSGRASFVKSNLDEEDTSEDIRKLAHADLYLGLNQTRREKMAGVIRINVMAHRHDDFSFLAQIMVLQSLKLGQPWLDGEFCARTYKRLYGSIKKKRGGRNAKN